MNENNDEWVLDLPLTKQGNSLAVVVPAKNLRILNLGLGDKVRVILKVKEDD